MTIIILFLTGLIAGTLGAIVGLGGGIIIVPVLLFLGQDMKWLSGITPQTAAGTSIFTLIFTGLSSTISYLKKKMVDYQSAWLFFIGIAPGSILGSWANEFVNGDSFNLYFGIWLIFMAILLTIRNKLKPLKQTGKGIRRQYHDNEGIVHEYGYRIPTAVGLSLLVGFSSGFLGVGGGALIVPIMLLIFRFPPHLAVGTSMMIVFLSSIIGSVSHFLLDHIQLLYALALIPGAYLGGKIGVRISARLKGKTIIVLLRVIFVLIGVRMIIQTLW